MGNAVVHFDISGQNPAALETFYAGLFGWSINPVPGMSYSIIVTPGGSIDGGVGPAQGGPGQVTFYVQSDDLQASLDKAASLGGTVTQEVLDIPGVVKLAMFNDPAGNPIGLVGDSGGSPPPGAEPGTGAPVSWFEVMGPDAAALVAFYTELFGWEAHQYEIPGPTKYYEVKTGADRGIQGGIGQNPMGMSYVTVYAESTDLQATLDRATELGAKTILPPMKTGNGPEVAMFADPEGHTFGIYNRPAPPA